MMKVRERVLVLSLCLIVVVAVPGFLYRLAMDQDSWRPNDIYNSVGGSYYSSASVGSGSSDGVAVSVRGGVRSSRRVAAPVFSYARSAKGLSAIAVANSQSPIANSLVERGETVSLPTAFGEFMLTPFRQLNNGLEHIVLQKGEWSDDEPILCRVHSSCMTGDIFGSMRCECGEQLHKAMQMVEKEGKGIIVYLNQEGRGIGLMNKIRAYKLQEQGEDTVEANIHLGFQPDERDYGVGAQILQNKGAKKLRLITNNPVKRIGLESYGIEIVENIPIEIAPNPYNLRYMQTKKEKMYHNLNLV